MRNLLYLPLSLLVVLLTSCFDDKGNYDYKNIDEIKVSFPGNMGTDTRIVYAQKLGDTLSIHPDVVYGDSSALTYEWDVFEGNQDTKILKRTKNLDIPLEYGDNATIAWAVGGYSLQYTVTDTITKQTVRRLVYLTVRSLTPVGVYVLEGDKDSTDVTTIENDDFSEGLATPIVTHNYYSTVNGSRLKGEGRNICWWYVTNGEAYTGLLACTSQDLQLIDMKTFKKASDLKTLSSSTPVNGLPLMGYVSYAAGIGMLYTQSHIYKLSEDDAYENIGLDNEVKRGGISPAYFFSDGGSLGGNLNYADLSYDRNNSRFVQYDWYNAPSTQYEWPINLLGDDPNSPSFDPKDMKGLELIGVDYGVPTYYLMSQNQWAVFRKSSDHSIIACRINDEAYDKDEASYDVYKTIATDKKNQELENMNCFQMSTLTDGIGFFSTPSAVFLLDIINGSDISQLFVPDNSDEKITKIKLLKYNYMEDMENVNGTFYKRRGLSLYITTWDGKEGRLYRLPLTEEGQVDGSRSIDKWEGFKEIHDICFRLQ